MTFKVSNLKIIIPAAVVVIALIGAGIYFLGTRSPNSDPGDEPPVNRRPLANAGPDQVIQAGEAVILDGTQSSDPDGDTLIFQWDVDDNVDEDSDGFYDNDGDYTGENVTHTYPVPEEIVSYRVTLNVSDGEKWDKSTMTVTILISDNSTIPFVTMSCSYDNFPGPYVEDQFRIMITDVTSNEMTGNFSYMLEDPNGSIIQQGTVDELIIAGLNATIRYVDMVNVYYVSEQDSIIIKDRDPIEEGFIFSLYYRGYADPVGSVELTRD
ncbi:MAG: PKD domain-containing protein [Thermoplasmatota archaeon]